MEVASFITASPLIPCYPTNPVIATGRPDYSPRMAPQGAGHRKEASLTPCRSLELFWALCLWHSAWLSAGDPHAVDMYLLLLRALHVFDSRSPRSFVHVIQPSGAIGIYV